MKPLDTKELSVGMRVIKIGGEVSNREGVVRAVNRAENRFAVLFDGDRAVTMNCDPTEFRKVETVRPHLTGKPPPGTIARGSL
ncbi:MAG TPA: hypothetical protein VJJ55_02010 [Candidatus Paceibacterota bacterium]